MLPHLDPLEGVEVAGEGALADRPDAAVAQLEAHEGREAGEREGLMARQWSGHYRARSFSNLLHDIPSID